ncbi:MAG: hypothetical protein V1897_09605 [Pseudomonadota bacterium]
MKCQSDYDNEEQALVRQADECVQPWWDGEAQSAADQSPKVKAPEQEVNTAESEALKRGLLKQEQSGELCLSCPEGDE